VSLVVVFDLDDTLYPESQFVRSGFKAVDAWLAKDRAITGFYDAAWELFQNGTRKVIFDEALRKLKVKDPKIKIPDLVKRYRAHKPTLALYPDAREALRQLRSKVKLGLLTDGFYETQKNKVEALEMEALFDATIYTDELGRENWKPSPLPFRRLMERIPSASRRYVYVGDNPEKDFIAPKALGWRTFQVVREGGVYAGRQAPANGRADRVIKSLQELPLLLAASDLNAS
jgi:putative hydrolase of the HAD superfamily